MLFPMSVVVLKLIVLMLQSVKRLVFNMPATATSFHHEVDITGREFYFGNPRKVKFFAIANLPIVEKIDQQIGMRFIQRNLVNPPITTENLILSQHLKCFALTLQDAISNREK